MPSLIGGLFDASSSSSAEDKRAQASEQAQLAYGSNSDILNPYSVQLKGNSKLNTAPTYNLGKGASLVIGDTKPVEDLSKAFAESVADMSKANSAGLSDAMAGLGDQLKSAFAQLTTLSESKQTEGESGRNQYMLWFVLGVLALMGFIFFWRR